MNAEDFPTPDAGAETAPEVLEGRIDGENVESINVPCFEFLDEEIDDVLAQTPDDREITVLRAKGGSSEYVAGALEERVYDVDCLELGPNNCAASRESLAGD